MQNIVARSLVRWCVAGMLAFGATSAFAQDAGVTPGTDGGISTALGFGPGYKRLNLNYETPTFWSHDLGSWGRLDATGEFGVSFWRAADHADRPEVWQLNAIPMLRWWFLPRFYVEAGVGATVFNHTKFADEQISTAYQFGDQIGVGYLVTDHSRIGLRLSHFSNADIKTPNPGLDAFQVLYTYMF